MSSRVSVIELWKTNQATYGEGVEKKNTTVLMHEEKIGSVGPPKVDEKLSNRTVTAFEMRIS